MSIPGVNLLAIAFEVIGTQIVKYRPAAGRTQNSQRQWVPSFGEFFDLEASVQRVPRKVYVQHNLEFQRNYITVFASINMIDLDRDTQGDQLVYNSRLYQLESQGTWFAQDGWAVCMAVDIGPAPVIPPTPTP